MRPVRTILSIIALILLVAALSHAWSTQPWRPYWTPYVQKGWEGKQWDKNIYASVEDETGATSYRCSMVAGTAFFQAVGVDLSPYVGDLLILTDSTGKQAYGYISAAGGGETLSAEVLTNAGLETYAGIQDNGVSDTFTDWNVGSTNDGVGNTVEATATVHGGANAAKITRTTTASYPILFSAKTVIAQALYLYSFWTRGDGTYSGQYQLYDGSNSQYIQSLLATGITGTTYTLFTRYFTTPVGCVSLNVYGNYNSNTVSVVYFDDFSLKRVTDCAATGVHIVSTPNGSVQSWASITSGFNPNDAAMTFDIYETGNLP